MFVIYVYQTFFVVFKFECEFENFSRKNAIVTTQTKVTIDMIHTQLEPDAGAAAAAAGLPGLKLSDTLAGGFLVVRPRRLPK